MAKKRNGTSIPGKSKKKWTTARDGDRNLGGVGPPRGNCASFGARPISRGRCQRNAKTGVLPSIGEEAPSLGNMDRQKTLCHN